MPVVKWIVRGAFVALSIMLFAGCAGENGAVGPSGTAECMKCHTDDFQSADFLLPKETQFAISRHNTGDTFLRRGSTSSPACSGCHTTEGFQLVIKTGAPGPVTESSRIGCFACHAPHSSFDFGLRKEGPTVIALGGAYDKGSSNTCGMCHQARTPVPQIAHVDSMITNSRWGPHHSTQANALIGNGAYHFAAADPYPTDHQHNAGIADGCVHCHMAPIPADNLAGGHSFSVMYGEEPNGRVNAQTACRSCHSAWTTDALATTDVLAYQTEFAEKLETLKGLLVTRTWLNDATGLVNTANVHDLTEADRGAIFNYLYLEGDLGHGVHNPAYETAVVEATIAYLSTP